MRLAAWVEQADILREASLVVCHGGSGTTFGALAAGVPVVIIPAFADQFANALGVVRAGAGIQVRADGSPGTVAGESRAPFGRADAPRIRKAIDTVLADDSYRDCARSIAARDVRRSRGQCAGGAHGATQATLAAVSWRALAAHWRGAADGDGGLTATARAEFASY